MPEPRVAVVTGGSRGIGRGIACRLASLGMSLVVNYRNRADAAAETCAEALRLGAPEAIAIRADVSDLAAGRSLVDECTRRFGAIDVWVNNAGVAPERRLDLLETTPESFDRVLATDLRGPFFLAQAAARAMIEHAPAQTNSPRTRYIVFITSISSAWASTNRGEYCVAKAGLGMTAQLFAARLAQHDIAVFDVRPGIISTEMSQPAAETYDRKIAEGLLPIGRWGTPDDVGRVVASLVSGALPYATGNVVYVDGGFHLARL